MKLLILFLFSSLTYAQTFKVHELKSLKEIPVPGPSEEVLAKFIKNKKAAIQLGKALFWDMRVGSDNKTACASCHFHAGADNRIKNQINPGLLAKDIAFQFGRTNHTLKKEDFPLALDSNEVISSQGVFHAEFKSVDSRRFGPDECKVEVDGVFHGLAYGRYPVNTRKVEPRHTPSVINAVFYFRQFWDGRANNIFNGIDPFGMRNSSGYVWQIVNGKPEKVVINLPSSSMASQASGPPLSEFEMSCVNRTFYHVGKKMVYAPILMQQYISRHDSVLGKFSRGRRPSYQKLIRKAFHKEFWDAQYKVYGGGVAASMDLVTTDPLKLQNEEMLPLIEANFAFFFGLSLQLYQSTLVSDQTRFDRFLEGDTTALNEQEQRGLNVFRRQGGCVRCHGGAEMSSASFSNVNEQRLTRIPFGGGITSDTGFFNIGVRPATEDPGVGNTDPFGHPMSETLMVKNNLYHLLGNDFDPERNPKPEEITNVGVDGAFKTPTLRNIALTGPYFHNGGKATLRQVVEFYNRGGDFPNGAIRPLNLTEEQKQDLVAFMLALTDDRVKLKKAPFDHPSLCFPHGHVGNSYVLKPDGRSKNARDVIECLPAVGKYGVHPKYALKPFLNLDPFTE